MNKLSLSVVATAIVSSFATNAAEIFKNETSSVDLYGRVYATYLVSDEANDGDDSYIRLGTKMKTQINEGLYGKGRVEFNVDQYDETEKDSRIRIRQAWAGLGGDWGMVSYGRQYGAMTLVSDYTDVLYNFGGSALGQGSDTYATGRTSGLFKYSGSFSGLALEAGFQPNNPDESEYEVTDDEGNSETVYDSFSAFGVAAEYAIADTGLAVAASYTSGETSDETASLTAAGVKYDANGIYAGMTYSTGSDWDGNEDLTGMEAAFSYKISKPAQVLVGYNKQEVENDGESSDSVDYFTIGAQYKFNSNIRARFEHKMENIDGNEDVTALTLRYDF